MSLKIKQREKKLINVDRMDSLDAPFFARELEHIKTETYDVQYAELMARQVIPVSMEADPTDDKITYRQFDHVGIAKFIEHYGQDLPRADIKGKEFTADVRALGDSYGYNVDEIAKARKLNRPLDRMKSDAAKRAILELENTTAFFGDSDRGLLGFLNHPNVPEVTLPADGTGSSVEWADKTPVQILRDLNLVVNSIVETSKKVEKPDSLLLPVTAHLYLASTPIGDNVDKTILKFFLDNQQFIKNVESLNELETAGDSSTRRMMVYTKNVKKVSLEIPLDFTQEEEEKRGLEWIIPCRSKMAGVLFYYPLSAAYADGF